MQSINPSSLPAEPAATWLSAGEALALLGIRPQSLYASVSRGRIRTRPDARDPRRRLYHRDDVSRLAVRRAGALPARDVAARVFAWGEPVLDSAVSTISQGELWYAGRPVDRWLSEGATLEDVAALLWGVPAVRFQLPGPASAPDESGLGAALARLASRAADRRHAPATPDEAGAIVGLLARAWLGAGTVADDGEALPLHRRIALHWRRPAASESIGQALVLLADHELNASTFAARIAVSTGASLASAVLAGLATLAGPLHGGAAAGLQALVGQARLQGPEEAVRAHLAHGHALPAFGHPLYPDGDPRAARLLAGCMVPADFSALAQAVARRTGALPNVDFALAVLAEVHALPPDAPLALFSMARSVGWLAHAMEQRRSGLPIRPRARYTGPRPAGDAQA
jgi:citrate synthase